MKEAGDANPVPKAETGRATSTNIKSVLFPACINYLPIHLSSEINKENKMAND